MIRTSLILPETLHQRLVIASRVESKKPSALIRELLERALHRQEEKRLQQMYSALKELDGIGNPAIRDASTTIDNVLYGDSTMASDYAE